MWAPAVTGHICSVLFTGIQTQPQWPGFVHAEPPNILICAPQSTALVNFSLAITSDLSLPRSPPSPENMWSYVPPVGCGQKWACSGDTGLPAHPKHSKPTPTSHSPLPHGVPEVTLLVKLCYLSLQTLVNERRRCKMTSISDARLVLYFFNQITWLPALVIAPSRVCFGAQCLGDSRPADESETLPIPQAAIVMRADRCSRRTAPQPPDPRLLGPGPAAARMRGSALGEAEAPVRVSGGGAAQCWWGARGWRRAGSRSWPAARPPARGKDSLRGGLAPRPGCSLCPESGEAAGGGGACEREVVGCVPGAECCWLPFEMGRGVSWA